MDSDVKDEDSATKHILNYYRKYSQNKELPKYFSGTSLSYLPEVKDVDSPETEIKTLLKTDINIIVTSEELDEITPEKPENMGELACPSTASSPMSNYKLEWDNGADIGYDNCQEKRLRKSLSLPIIGDLIEKRLSNEFGPVTSNIVTRSQSSSSDGNVKIVLLTCSSSSEYQSDENNKKEENYSTDTDTRYAPNSGPVSISSSDSSNKRSLKQFASTLSYLKQKIGLPDAHSTPRYANEQQSDTDAGSDTPVVKSSSGNNEEDKISTTKLVEVDSKYTNKKLTRKPGILKMVPPATSEENLLHKKSDHSSSGEMKKNITKYQNPKVVTLAVTKPITVECTCSNQSLTNKSLQTLTKQSTVAVQTDEISEHELTQIVQSGQRNYNNQSLMYFEYSESDKISGQAPQTDSDIVESNCDSFEYLTKDPPQSKSSILKKIHNNTETKSVVSNATDIGPPEDVQASNLKRAQRTHDLRTSSKENSEKSSSIDFSVADLISSGLFENVDEDIEKSVYLLQKLLKSKKYDHVTKKKYIKKIVKKITESKYLQDSSTSSDLFVPKKLPKASSSGDKVPNNILQSNVPWYPVVGEQLKLSPKEKKLVQKTFTQDFIPAQNSSGDISSAPEIVPVNSRDTRKNRFTLINNEFSGNHRHDKSTGKSKPDKSYSETDSTSLEKHYESSSTSKSYQNWKEDKTLSEKILEKRSEENSPSSNGNGDCFVKFADKERQFQINWIDNEISHLGKLKGLLQKPKIKHKRPLNVKKTTNVYTVSNENDTNSKLKRNYVIETLIGTQSSSEMNFKLDGHVYTVQEYLHSKRKNGPKKSRQVTGNIEVVSSDSTTNIKVSTFCEECKRSPCTCNVEYEESCTCHLDIGEENCGSQSCICHGESLAKVVSAARSDADSDQACACVDSSSSANVSNYICSICKKYSCTCDTKYKELKISMTSSNEITGTFIPAAPPRPTVIKFATYPSTSKEESRRKQNLMSSNQDINRIDRAASAISKSGPLQTDQTSSYGSLRKVFENCACTQTDCSCDFVEKLMNCFSKTDIPCTVISDNKCLQTDKSIDKSKIQAIGLQTHIETENQNQQTVGHTVDDKCLQTEKFMDKNVETQTQLDTQSQNQQTYMLGNNIDVQTEHTKLEDIQDIGIQTRIDVKDQVLQTTQSVNEQNNALTNSVGTHISVNGETQTKGVSFVDRSSSDHVKIQEVTATQTVASVGTSVDHAMNQRDEATSPIHNLRKQQDATTSPFVHSASTSPDHAVNKKDTVDAERRQRGTVLRSSSTSADDGIDQQAAASETNDAKQDYSRSETSRPTSSKSSSSTSDHNKKKIICVCCCTQTGSESRGKSKTKNAKVQIESNEVHSDKENVRQKGGSLTTSSTIYEICPSILVSSFNGTSQSISEESSPKPSIIICVCCNDKYPSDKISVLGSKNENYPICCNCLAKRPILTAVCYAGPEENCPCSKPPSYAAVKTDVSDETKKNATDSNDFEEYCTCTKPFQFRNSKYCSYCQFKLRNTAKSKNGIAYTLTLETDCLNKIRRKRKKMPLEEIKLKVPSPSSKKKHKDKENVSKRDKEGKRKDQGSDKQKQCDCGKIICTKNCHVHGISSKHRRDKNSLTLQEYLQKNRPGFIESAETRRHLVLNSKSEREFGQTDAKLRFAEENRGQTPLRKSRKLFTEQEMKEITKRNYKKLPEVKEKMNSQKEQRLRNADRFIVDVFARKIQRSVLKGKSSFPIDSNVICLPKTCNC